MSHFQNRMEAGRKLAKRLAAYRGLDDLVVLALPRGGVPVAFEIAEALAAPLDLCLVRKLGLPGHEELAFGAIASGGIRVINDEIAAAAGLTAEEVDLVVNREALELARRLDVRASYRHQSETYSVEQVLRISLTAYSWASASDSP